MKKFLMVALIAGGILTGAAPKSHAGVSIGIGVGFPGYYPVGYGYPYYGYPYCAPYYPYRAAYYRPAYIGYRPYYWRHGRRFYYRHCRR